MPTFYWQSGASRVETFLFISSRKAKPSASSIFCLIRIQRKNIFLEKISATAYRWLILCPSTERPWIKCYIRHVLRQNWLFETCSNERFGYYKNSDCTFYYLCVRKIERRGCNFSECQFSSKGTLKLQGVWGPLFQQFYENILHKLGKSIFSHLQAIKSVITTGKNEMVPIPGEFT